MLKLISIHCNIFCPNWHSSKSLDTFDSALWCCRSNSWGLSWSRCVWPLLGRVPSRHYPVVQPLTITPETSNRLSRSWYILSGGTHFRIWGVGVRWVEARFDCYMATLFSLVWPHLCNSVYMESSYEGSAQQKLQTTQGMWLNLRWHTSYQTRSKRLTSGGHNS